MRKLVFLSFLFFFYLPVKADTITFWHVHRNADYIGDHCFDNKSCFGTHVVLEKQNIKPEEIFFILFGGCMVPEKLTLILREEKSGETCSLSLPAFARGDFKITGKDILKIKPGKYYLELFPSTADESAYSGFFELR